MLFARRRAPIVQFRPARLLAALTSAQANLAGDSTFFRLRMDRQGRWPNARAAGRGGAWSFPWASGQRGLCLQVPER